MTFFLFAKCLFFFFCEKHISLFGIHLETDWKHFKESQYQKYFISVDLLGELFFFFEFPISLKVMLYHISFPSHFIPMLCPAADELVISWIWSLLLYTGLCRTLQGRVGFVFFFFLIWKLWYAWFQPKWLETSLLKSPCFELDQKIFHLDTFPMAFCSLAGPEQEQADNKSKKKKLKIKAD